MNETENTLTPSDGFQADLSETIGYEKLDEALNAWSDRNGFLTKYDKLRTTSYPLYSREDVEQSIDTLNGLINGSGLNDDDKRTLMDCIKTVSQLFDNYGLSFALDFVHRNMEYALDEELERMKADEMVNSRVN